MTDRNRRTPELARVLREVLAHLGQRVEFCILRNYEELPDYTAHDVDVLVWSDEMDAAVRAVREGAEAAEWKRLGEVRQMGTHSLCLFHDCSAQPQFVTFDLVCDLPWRWMPTGNIPHVFATAVTHKGMRVASPGVEAALRLIKEVVRGRMPSGVAWERIVNGAADTSGFRGVFRDVMRPGAADLLLQRVVARDAEALAALSLRLRRSLVWHAHTRHPLRQAVRFLRYGVSRWNRFRRGALGAFVVMIGPDGVGKSTLSRRLQQGIGELVFHGTEVFHGHFGLLPRLRDVARSATGAALREADFTAKHSGSDQIPHSPWRTLFYLAYYTWDFCLGRLRVFRLRGNSRLVLFDRYFYDYYYQRASSRTPWAVLDAFRAFVPQPDVVLLLRAAPSAIYARKPELNEEEIRRQLEMAERLATRIADRVPVVRVDTDRGEDLAEQQAVRGILNAIRRKNYGDAERC
jgi:thymidylate kinase